MPVYQALEDSNQHDLAVQWNDENKDFYHPVAESSVMKIIGGQEASESRLTVLAKAVEAGLSLFEEYAEQALANPFGFLQ